MSAPRISRSIKTVIEPGTPLATHARARRGVRFPVAKKIDRTVDGIEFDSKGEATRYATLKILERQGLIEDLRIQVRFPVDINGSHYTTFTADFVYFDVALGREKIEDAKSSGTAKDAAYRLRKKAAELSHKIKIDEVLG